MRNITHNYENQTVLLTGSNGYVGNEFNSLLEKLNCIIIKSKGDLTLKQTWLGLLDQKVDYIFHLAASEGSGKDLSMNSRSVLLMLEACVEKKCFPKIIFLSSTNLFGLTACSNVNENSQSYPISEFSSHKLLAENYLRYYYKMHKISSIILRIPNIFGPVEKPENFSRVVLNRVIRSAYETGELTVFNNKYCRRDYIFITDLLEALILASLLEKTYFNGKFFILGPNFSHTIEQIWKIIQSKVKNSKITYDPAHKLSPMEYRNFSGIGKKFKKITCWEPEISIEKGVDLTLEKIS